MKKKYKDIIILRNIKRIDGINREMKENCINYTLKC